MRPSGRSRGTRRAGRWGRSSGSRWPPVNESQAEQELPTAQELAVETSTLFASLAFARLDEKKRDLEQARVAIEALKALLAALPEDRRKDFEHVLANLQLAYADAAK